MEKNSSKTHKIREQLTVKQEFNLILYLMLELIEKCNLTPLQLYPCQINLHYQFYYNENYLHFHLHMNWGIHRPAMNKYCSQTTSKKGEWKGSVVNFYSSSCFNPEC